MVLEVIDVDGEIILALFWTGICAILVELELKAKLVLLQAMLAARLTPIVGTPLIGFRGHFQDIRSNGCTMYL